jgi:hypothetical protein
MINDAKIALMLSFLPVTEAEHEEAFISRWVTLI